MAMVAALQADERRRWVAWRALFSAMSIASPPPEREHRVVQPSGECFASFSASIVRASEGKWWLPMSKRSSALKRRDHLGVAVAERVDAAVQMQVDQPAPSMS